MSGLNNMGQKARAWLELARVSNSPTVATNTLAGAALASDLVFDPPLFFLIAATLSFYSGGMILNDVCDYGHDRIQRPLRPLPKGVISRKTAGIVGILFLAAGLVLLSSLSLEALWGGFVLGALIVSYNLRHKENPLGPLIMASCRVMVYCISFLAFLPKLNTAIIITAAILGLYVFGLTFVAKYKDKKGNVTGKLIAGISLYDGIVLGFAGSPAGAYLSGAAFLLTLFFQRYIRGT